MQGCERGLSLTAAAPPDRARSRSLSKLTTSASFPLKSLQTSWSSLLSFSASLAFSASFHLS